MTTLPRVPRLQPGDTLPRAEFERRYAAMRDVKKAELLEGVVHMPSPVRFPHHGAPHALLTYWLSHFAAATPGVRVAIDATVRLDLDNEPQPDLQLRIDGVAGTSRIDADGYVDGPPELVVEIAASSVSIDLHQKLRVYRRAGVREYLVVRAEDVAVDWFANRGGVMIPLACDGDGVVRSEVFAGLWLAVAALWRSDAVAIREAVEAGTRTAAHAAFVARLAAGGG